MRPDKLRCPGCGWTNENCICDPRGGYFASWEDKREYYSKHPDSKGRVLLVRLNHDEILQEALRKAYPEKAENEIQNMISNLEKECPNGNHRNDCR